ncbi:helix-turn-helix domain-containing protein [Clostridium butyricum]|uniref:Primosome, DnaD subunit n=1 Tax=Clostridium butyricum E4 str. BoNT E BL5262 TaxID=632245 RepID=C4IGY1_CLOBU|nr:helix-turn-helix domain-containing protein [Clostridium butyricum]EEP53130.1 primosome, DnaD subunit [Clostridium butyricum E4 str. BoNT E BL5262]NFS19501.1 helix-turn-helix domain-containing protein [Clostridium butyricum]
MTKDYLKFRNSIKEDTNLNLEESYLLEVLFDYYNTSCGYAFPPYEILMHDLKTKRRAKISKLLKSLEKKGYISINKKGKKNIYYILKYLFLNKSNSKVKQKHNAPVDSNGNIPVEGQMHVEEIINTKEHEEVIKITGFNKKQADELLKAADKKVDKIVQAFEYSKSKGKAVFAYVRWCIKNLDIASLIKRETNRVEKHKLKFYNFEQRHYNYDKLEKGLLGWDNNINISECIL